MFGNDRIFKAVFQSKFGQNMPSAPTKAVHTPSFTARLALLLLTPESMQLAGIWPQGDIFYVYLIINKEKAYKRQYIF